MIYGYARVSSKDQNLDRQLICLIDNGVPTKNIYVDKKSGKDFNRENYKRLIRRLKSGDVLYIKSIDRLGRNYDDIQEQWRLITHTKNADIVIIDMPLLDTRSDNDLTGKLISDIVLQLLSYVAETERDFIHQRQSEGIAAARNRGVSFGRKALKVPKNYIQVKNAYINHEINSRQAGKLLNVSHTTFLKWVKDL